MLALSHHKTPLSQSLTLFLSPTHKCTDVAAVKTVKIKHNVLFHKHKKRKLSTSVTNKVSDIIGIDLDLESILGFLHNQLFQFGCSVYHLAEDSIDFPLFLLRLPNCFGKQLKES